VGDRRLADLHAAAYRTFKADEPGRAVAGDLRRADQWANRESLPIHIHEEAVPPPAGAPSWVGALGPQGYRTDFGYLTRAHPPIRRDAVEPAGVVAPGPSRRDSKYAPISSEKR
jgi:hypothetical protein